MVLRRENLHVIDFPPAIDVRPFLLRRLAPPGRGRALPAWDPGARHVPREDIAFIDTETTGLSTGAGTFVFAFGAGRFGKDGFHLTQLFLEDYPGEPAFLEAVIGLMREAAWMASYNGRCFDAPLLRSRCSMNGLRWPEPSQIDLLFTARRLWGRVLGSAGLADIEAGVLRSPRPADVPGSEAPERYLAYLRSGDPEPVLPVLEHHRADILSLPAVTAAALRCLEAPEESATCDRVRAGLILYLSGMDGWETCLSSASVAGDEEAAMCLAAIYKREGRWREALDIYSRMPTSPRSLIEAAKLYEHRLWDYRSALRVCGEALRLLSTEERAGRGGDGGLADEIRFRMDRLGRKEKNR
jgi:hypothetical protein